MKLVSINIEGDLHSDAVLAFLRKEKPDVVCVQELLAKDFDLYKKTLQMEGVYEPFMFWNKSAVYPTFTGQKIGAAIFATKIARSGSIFYVGDKENLNVSFEEYVARASLEKDRALVWADVVDSNGAEMRFVSLQLPVTTKGETTPYQLEVVDRLITKLNDLGEFVLCGDMNAPRGREAFGKLALRYKDNIPPQYMTSIDQNLHKAKGIQFMVDGLFTTKAYSASDVSLVDGLSDHMAVLGNIDFS